jgi:hypothetical protein
MKTFRTIQYAIAAALWSAGSIAWLLHATPASSICFYSFIFSLLKRSDFSLSEFNRSIPALRFWLACAFVALFAIFSVVTGVLYPHVQVNMLGRCVFIVVFWISGSFVIFWRWREESDNSGRLRLPPPNPA